MFIGWRAKYEFSPDMTQGKIYQDGFSLLEVLVAFSIFAVSFGILLQLYSKGSSSARLADDYARAVIIAQSSLANTTSSSINWNGPYLKKAVIPKDPWANDYHYQSPGDHGEYDLYSYGADNQPGGDKNDRDVNSWE